MPRSSAATGRSSSCSPARRTRATTTGKPLVQQLCSRCSGAPGIAGRVVFLDDYDLAHRPRASSRGCDVWVNLPRPPLEAQRHVAA